MATLSTHLRGAAARRSLLLIALIAALSLPTSLAAAVGRGFVEGPAVTVHVGSFYLVARTTEHPACLPLPEQCFKPRPSFRIPQPRYYTIWAGQISYPIVRGRPSPSATISGRHLLQIETTPARS